MRFSVKALDMVEVEMRAGFEGISVAGRVRRG